MRFSVQWKDIDFEKSTLSVRRVMVRPTGGEWRFAEPETARARRQITLPPSVVRVLREHRRSQAEERLGAGTDYENNELVFANEYGQPVHYRNLIRRHFKPLLKAADLPEVRFYDLRHTHPFC